VRAGTFGKLLYTSGTYDTLLGSTNVTVNLGCATKNIYYRQCIIPAEMAIILMSIASLLCVSGCVCTCFYCGCCKCLNLPGDTDNCGMCTRFCPWMPCAKKKAKLSDTPQWMENPVTEEENKSSLFGACLCVPLCERASGV
jgi:hypothetical protein